jgi:hypothetical protein
MVIARAIEIVAFFFIAPFTIILILSRSKQCNFLELTIQTIHPSTWKITALNILLKTIYAGVFPVPAAVYAGNVNAIHT